MNRLRVLRNDFACVFRQGTRNRPSVCKPNQGSVVHRGRKLPPEIGHEDDADTAANRKLRRVREKSKSRNRMRVKPAFSASATSVEGPKTGGRSADQKKARALAKKRSRARKKGGSGMSATQNSDSVRRARERAEEKGGGGDGDDVDADGDVGVYGDVDVDHGDDVNADGDVGVGGDVGVSGDGGVDDDVDVVGDVDVDGHGGGGIYAGAGACVGSLGAAVPCGVEAEGPAAFYRPYETIGSECSCPATASMDIYIERLERSSSGALPECSTVVMLTLPLQHRIHTPNSLSDMNKCREPFAMTAVLFLEVRWLYCIIVLRIPAPVPFFLEPLCRC